MSWEYLAVISIMPICGLLIAALLYVGTTRERPWF